MNDRAEIHRRRLVAGLIAAGLTPASGLAKPIRQGRAQAFAGLGDAAEGFLPVVPGRRFAFPEDHGAHDGFRIEWWYLTANLKDEDGELCGLQWTLFRGAVRPEERLDDPAGDRAGWASPYVYMAHAAVTTAQRHEFAERFARAGVGQAGVTAAPFHGFLDDWRFLAESPDFLRANVAAATDCFSYRLALQTTAAPALQGEGGYSRKSDAGDGSYYYSQPFFEAEGEIFLDGRTRRVSGLAWMDREWSSELLAEDQIGWDWFSLHLAGGEKAMLFQLRSRDGGRFRSGSWIAPNGEVANILGEAASLTPHAPRRLRAPPTRWRLRIPSRSLDVEAEALNPDARMRTTFPYWEGPVRISGTHEGVGYLEMTGYA